MELRQIQYFLAAAKLGSLGKAAAELGLATSAVSQQISRLESELSVRLLNRSTSGVSVTQAGENFFQQMTLAMRHMDAAVESAKVARLSGAVSLGLAPTTSLVLALPLIEAMAERYPSVRLQIIEGMSGHLSNMLKSRQLDLAILFNEELAGGTASEAVTLLDERLFLIGPKHADLPEPDADPFTASVKLSEFTSLPLILPSRGHGLRVSLDRAFALQQLRPNIAMEIDSLAIIMSAVGRGRGYTVQPGAALKLSSMDSIGVWPISDANASRCNILVSLPDQELSPAALALRAQLKRTVQQIVRDGQWVGASLL